MQRDIYTNVAFQTYMVKLENIYSYVNTGKLPPFLVPDSYLKSIFRNINHRLARTGSEMRVPTLSPHSIYTDLKVYWTRIGSDVLLTLNIPIAELNYKYSLYKVDSFWIPSNSTDSSSTKIAPESITKFLAINHDGNSYLWLTIWTPK